MSSLDLKDKVALVTGAGNGIGAATAKALAKKGAHVVMVDKNTPAMEEVDDAIQEMSGSATLIPLDLSDLKSVDTLGPNLYERFGRLDIFIGNAAILGPVTPLPHLNAGDWDSVIQVNLTANFRLIRTLDPLLKKSESGRVVFITSGVTTIENPAYWGPYMVSKAGLEALTRVYAGECANTPIRVNSFSPGIVNTSMSAQAFPGREAEDLADPAEVALKILDLCSPECQENGHLIAA